jgi:hypothetical protein
MGAATIERRETARQGGFRQSSIRHREKNAMSHPPHECNAAPVAAV